MGSQSEPTRFLQAADADIRGTMSFAYGTPVTSTRVALVWAWSDRAEETQASGVFQTLNNLCETRSLSIH